MAGQASRDTLYLGKALWGAGRTLEKSKGAFVCLKGGMNEKGNLFLQAPAQGRLLRHLPRTPVLAWGEGLTLRGHSQCVVGISWTRDQESSSFTDLHFLMPC